MYSKSVVAERFIRMQKHKIYQHMTAMSKKVYFDVLEDILDKYNKTYHTATRMNPVDVKFGSFTEYSVDSNAKKAKVEMGNHVKTAKCESIFAKTYLSHWYQEVFVISKVKNTVPRTYFFSDVNAEEIDGTFYEK